MSIWVYGTNNDANEKGVLQSDLIDVAAGR
jgi:hypothetical protein